tara:strand:- start:325 stop:687 length:363 start_codon:yes stop_codon:yes gene_type:complete
MTDEEYTEIKEDDFIVRVRPFKDKKGSWNGEIDIAIITQPENSFDDEDYYQLTHFCKMLASTVPIMEHNEELRSLVHEYVTDIVDKEKEYLVELEERPKVVDRDDNIITIDFGTTTKGSA